MRVSLEWISAKALYSLANVLGDIGDLCWKVFYPPLLRQSMLTGENADLSLLQKFIADLFLLYPVLRFFKRKDLIKWIFPFELFYSFYIVLIVVLSFTKSFEWKGRTHKK